MIFLLSLAITPTLWAIPNTFEEWVATAKEKDPIYLKAMATRDVAQAKYHQNLATLLPSAGIRYTRTWTDVTPDTKVPSVFVDWSFIKGFQDWTLFRSSRFMEAAANESLLDADILLRERLAKNLLDFSKATETVAIIKESLGVIDRRIRELEKRVSRGQNRQVDLINTRIELLDQQRRLSQNSSVVAEKIQELEEATGIRLDENFILKTEEIVNELENQKTQRSDFKFKALEYGMKAAKAEETLFYGKWIPSLTLNYSYYPYKGQKDKSTSLDQSKFALQAEWTFFEGLKSFALRKEKAANAIATEQDYLLELKQERTRSKLWKKRIQEIKEQLTNLNQAVTLADKAFSIQEKDYRLGLVTDLDVATSVQNRLNVKLSRIQALYDLGFLSLEKMKISNEDSKP
ncbi:MAG: TolC family protein [Proteobacteria bacterium]|nr:TolC family protein [Pseudomonadota bacterium]